MAEIKQFRRPLPPIDQAESAQKYNAALQQYVLDRKHLAEWLRQQADLIESDRVEVEPRAAMLVLSGARASESLHLGFGREGAPTIAHAFQAARSMLNQYGSGKVDSVFIHPIEPSP